MLHIVSYCNASKQIAPLDRTRRPQLNLPIAIASRHIVHPGVLEQHWAILLFVQVRGRCELLLLMVEITVIVAVLVLSL